MCYKIDDDVSAEEQSFKIPVNGQEHLSWVIQDDLIRNMIVIGQVLPSRDKGNFLITESNFLKFDNTTTNNNKFTVKLNLSAKRKCTTDVCKSNVSIVDAEPTKTKRGVGKKNDGGEGSMAIVAKEKNKDLGDNVLLVKPSDTGLPFELNDVKRKADLDRDNRSAKRNGNTLLVDADDTREKGC